MPFIVTQSSKVDITVKDSCTKDNFLRVRFDDGTVIFLRQAVSEHFRLTFDDDFLPLGLIEKSMEAAKYWISQVAESDKNKLRASFEARSDPHQRLDKFVAKKLRQEAFVSFFDPDESESQALNTGLTLEVQFRDLVGVLKNNMHGVCVWKISAHVEQITPTERFDAEIERTQKK